MGKRKFNAISIGFAVLILLTIKVGSELLFPEFWS